MFMCQSFISYIYISIFSDSRLALVSEGQTDKGDFNTPSSSFKEAGRKMVNLKPPKIAVKLSDLMKGKFESIPKYFMFLFVHPRHFYCSFHYKARGSCIIIKELLTFHSFLRTHKIK